MIIIVICVICGVVGGIFLGYLGRHPKCPYCGERVNFVIPMLLKRCKSTYTCNNCQRVVPSIKFRPRQGVKRK